MKFCDNLRCIMSDEQYDNLDHIDAYDSDGIEHTVHTNHLSVMDDKDEFLHNINLCDECYEQIEKELNKMGKTLDIRKIGGVN